MRRACPDVRRDCTRSMTSQMLTLVLSEQGEPKRRSREHVSCGCPVASSSGGPTRRLILWAGNRSSAELFAEAGQAQGDDDCAAGQQADDVRDQIAQVGRTKNHPAKDLDEVRHWQGEADQVDR